VSREFNDTYAGHVMRWFEQVGEKARGAATKALA
jgi:hypothetical protein